MSQYPKIATYTVLYSLLLIAKIISFIYGWELIILSSGIFSRLTNIFYILRQDILIGGVLAVSLYRAQWKKTKRIIGAVVLYMLLYAVDIWLYTIFLSRLAPSQYLTFLTQDTIKQFISYTWILVGIFAGIIVCTLWLYKILQKYIQTYLFPAVIRIGLLVISITGLFSQVKQELVPYKTNIITLQSKVLLASSKLYNNSQYQDYAIIQQPQYKSPNVIVLFAESRSAIDSLRAWWLYDNFPKFDQIQEDGKTFTNFFAHGCTSDSSHIAFLQGTEPRATMLPGGAYEKYKDYRWYLPKYFQDYGYNTQFFSTVSLDFLDQRSYIEKLWFNIIRGEENFITAPKYVFDAAPDQYLYDTILTQVQNTTGDFLFVAQSVSSHHPYNSPYGKIFTDAMRYSDDTFADFYAKLKEMNYFDDGYLVVFSDHRKIAPLTREEFQHFGRSAYNRGVATIIGPDIKANTFDDTPYQHIDFYHGLKLLIGQNPLTIPSITNDPFWSYVGRDWSVRYCQYQDPRYYITEKDGQTEVFENAVNTQAKSYISAYENWHNNNTQITEKSSISDTHGITLVAHQWAPAGKHPANSIAAMRQAAQDGAKGVEFDVSRTTDGYHVVVHGPDMGSIQCTEIKRKFIYQYSFAELRKNCTLSDGTAILTLSEMLEKLDGLFESIYVDVKVYNTKNALKQWEDIIDIITQFDRHKKIIPIAYDPTLANYLLEQNDKTTIGRDSYDFDLPKLLKSPVAAYLIWLNLLTPENIPVIQQSTIPVVAYTISSYDDMTIALDVGIIQILVSDIVQAKTYINKYFENKD